jgi:lauroyl/myristoyl acyltransferase
MIVYRVIRWAGTRPKTVKMRTSDKRARLDQRIRTYRRQWFWNEDRWNQRHGIKDTNTVQEHM